MANSINPYVMLENIKHQEAYKTKRKYEYTNLAINTAGSIASCFIPLIKNAETTPPKTNPPVQKEEKENKDNKILSTEEIKKEQEEKAIKYAWQQINGDHNKIDNYFKADLRNHYQKIISDAAQKNETINPEILNKKLKNYAQAWAIKNQI